MMGDWSRYITQETGQQSSIQYTHDLTTYVVVNQSHVLEIAGIGSAVREQLLVELLVRSGHFHHKSEVPQYVLDDLLLVTIADL